MTEFEWNGYRVEVDEKATRDCYARAEPWGCECGHCRNFLALARERRLPGEILEILDSLSIPPEKATYVCVLGYDESWREKGLLYQISWRMAGTILDRPAGESNGQEWGPLVKRPWGGMLLGHESFPVEPDFPMPHFDLDTSLYLPWILDEPVEGPEEEET